MEYIILTAGAFLIIAGIGNQAIRYGGNGYFGFDHESITDCLMIGLSVVIKSAVVVMACAAFVWSVGEVSK